MQPAPRISPSNAYALNPSTSSNHRSPFRRRNLTTKQVAIPSFAQFAQFLTPPLSGFLLSSSLNERTMKTYNPSCGGVKRREGTPSRVPPLAVGTQPRSSPQKTEVCCTTKVEGQYYTNLKASPAHQGGMTCSAKPAGNNYPITPRFAAHAAHRKTQGTETKS